VPNAPIPKSDDNINYQWLHIDDFTPGIYDFDATNQEGSNDYIPAPLGSCIPAGTYGCIGLPSGGLAPLPWLATAPADWPYTVSTPIFLVGIETNTARVVNPLESTEVDTTELIIIAESDNGTAHVFAANSYIVETAVTNAILYSSSATTGKFWGSPYPQWTLLTGGTDTMYPALVFPSIVQTDSQGYPGHMYVYPSLSNPDAFGTDDLIPPSDSGRTGQLICYDGRVLGITNINDQWPTGSSTRFFSNEIIEYTDPPGDNTYMPTGEEFAILVPENPFGYGVAGSISAGELFLVKKRGGGVLVLGDIDAPSSVTYLPGVRPTGNFFGRGDSTVLGFVYCSQGAGAWVWNGSNVSTKLSPQLDDNFFDATTATGMASTNYGFFVKKWGPSQLVMFSNSWVFFEATNSWWKLSGSSGAAVPYYHYTDARDQHQIYALPLQITTALEPFLYTYDSRVQAPLWLWTSTQLYHHITKTPDRVIDIREIMITASNHWSNPGTIEVQIISNGSAVWTGNLDLTAGVDPMPYRLNAGALGLDNFRIAITAANSTNTPGSSQGAPTVWSVDIAYRTRAKVLSGN
jgi:hypothetical protein